MDKININGVFSLDCIRALFDTHQNMLLMLDRIGLFCINTMEDDLLNYESFINSILGDGDFTLNQLINMEIDPGDISCINPPEEERYDDETECARCVEWLGEVEGTKLHLAHHEFRTQLSYLVWVALIQELNIVSKTLGHVTPYWLTLTLSEQHPWRCWYTLNYR